MTTPTQIFTHVLGLALMLASLFDAMFVTHGADPDHLCHGHLWHHHLLVAGDCRGGAEMILYHGTTSRHLDSIREHGLLPRYDERPTRWDENPSATDRVYLTNAYAVWFAWTAAEAGEKGVVVAVDVEEEDLVADEDYLAQTNWQDEALAFLQDMSLEQRTLYWKNAHHPSPPWHSMVSPTSAPSHTWGHASTS